MNQDIPEDLTNKGIVPREDVARDVVSEVVVITGISGAGKSVVLRALEDIGFFCIDNLPFALMQPLFDSMISADNFAHRRIALGIDVRSGDDIAHVVDYIALVRKNVSWEIKVIFLTATLPTLIKRFQETRRKHPLAGSGDLSDAFALEGRLLSPIEHIADRVIDTDQLTIHQLRALTRDLFASCEQPRMMVTLTSFGFKYGVPSEHNFIFDVRSLPNPFFVPDLKGFDGRAQEIQTYLFAQQEVVDYWKRLVDFTLFCLENSYKEGRSFIQIGIGCTGGRHRSVAFVEKLAQVSVPYVQFVVKHRDMHKEA